MPTPEIPLTTDPEGPVFSESLQQATGINPIPTNVNPVQDDQGQPLISTQATTGAKIQLPSDRSTLLKKAKGSIDDAATWLARFFLRLLDKRNADTIN